MIVGIGTDMVDIRRIERLVARYGQTFLQRLYTPDEQTYADAASHPARRIVRYANRFAAKEATIKAIGMNGYSWQDIEVTRVLSGKPALQLHRLAHEAAVCHVSLPHNTYRLHLSLSDEYPYSIAYVTLSIG